VTVGQTCMSVMRACWRHSLYFFVNLVPRRRLSLGLWERLRIWGWLPLPLPAAPPLLIRNHGSLNGDTRGTNVDKSARTFQRKFARPASITTVNPALR